MSKNNVVKLTGRDTIIDPLTEWLRTGRMVQKIESLISGRFTVVVIEHTTKPFAAMNKIIG